MVTLKLRVPAPSSMLLINLLGLFGLVGVAVAVGGLTHNPWWSLLVGAAEAILLSVVAAMNAEPAQADGEADGSETVVRRPRAV